MISPQVGAIRSSSGLFAYADGSGLGHLRRPSSRSALQYLQLDDNAAWRMWEEGRPARPSSGRLPGRNAVNGVLAVCGADAGRRWLRTMTLLGRDR